MQRRCFVLKELLNIFPEGADAHRQTGSFRSVVDIFLAYILLPEVMCEMKQVMILTQQLI